MLVLFFTVAQQLRKQPHWRESVHEMFLAVLGEQRWKLFVMFGLMAVNWTIESLKWKIALKPVQPIRFLQAFKAILAGTCIASFTPNRVGEYLGRMLYVDNGNKVLSVTSTILCSMSQMLVTLGAGTMGILLFSSLPFYFGISWITPSFFRIAAFLAGVGAVGLGLVYFRFDPLVRRLNKWIRKNRIAISLPENFQFLPLLRILLLSAVRYSVFLLQYFLLFSLFGIPLDPQQVFTGVSVMFVLMSIIPTLTFLTDLGFRWLAGIQIFQVYTTNTAGILAVSLGIWLINLIIPALIGSLLILRIKLFQNK
jgi:hypothetical protein